MTNTFVIGAGLRGSVTRVWERPMASALAAFDPAAARLAKRCDLAEKILADYAEFNEERLADYRRALARMDWEFEFADDGQAYRKGRAALESLYDMQSEVDQDGAIWRSLAPKGAALPRVQS